jgi:Ion channel
MLANFLIASALLALTVGIHAAGLTAVSARTLKISISPDMGYWKVTFLMVRVTWMFIILHFIEIAVWAVFFWREKCLPDLESAFYFSGVTYATIGYGDLVLPREWRLFGPIEGVTGVLMCGLSVGVFFVIVSKIYRLESTSGKN